jgi:hypothetical protein
MESELESDDFFFRPTLLELDGQSSLPFIRFGLPLLLQISSRLNAYLRVRRVRICPRFQPRSDIVAAFDNLTVLAKGGSVVYSGPNVDAIPWFEAQGHDLPSEWFSTSASLGSPILIKPQLTLSFHLFQIQLITSLTSSLPTLDPEEKPSQTSGSPTSSRRGPAVSPKKRMLFTASRFLPCRRLFRRRSRI